MENLFKRPRKITEDIENRSVTWLELFYDLIFTVVLLDLTEGLVHHFTIENFLNTTVLFFLFLWSWNETSVYFDDHGNLGVINTVIMNSQIILTGIATLFIPEAVEGDFSHIIIAFMAIELLMIIIWLIVSYFDKIHRQVALSCALLYMMVLLFLSSGYFASLESAKVIVIISLLINYFGLFLLSPIMKKEYEEHSLDYAIKDSLIERYGLIMMITLGEVIAGFYTSLKYPIYTEKIVGFVLSAVLISSAAAIFYSILGDLEINVKSAVKMLAMRLLFLGDIYLIMTSGIALHLILEGHESLGIRLLFVLTLFASMTMIWLIRAIAMLPKNRHRAYIYLGVELAVYLGLTIMPKMVLLLGIDILLTIHLVHYIKTRDSVIK
ncbi:low temperature requirement protein A [Holzapfeliella floricola]|uniref:Integral membrane protein n=1 Tax=Holzapfeliella floricola DSM 23037 = JCM 16512 TaxID=1423744 RepID=A0A0R2DWU8_9LACO|nr:low temperature requirement protein A [Holzapfeliella floricola]KRN04660.1 integral membrane protein [Holzapfeliella floricola DSM 23037 = JCM 16512]